MGLNRAFTLIQSVQASLGRGFLMFTRHRLNPTNKNAVAHAMGIEALPRNWSSPLFNLQLLSKAALTIGRICECPADKAIHSPSVTSNLALRQKSLHPSRSTDGNSRSLGGKSSHRKNAPNSCVSCTLPLTLLENVICGQFFSKPRAQQDFSEKQVWGSHSKKYGPGAEITR